jgi:hypothetical protein
MSIETIIINGLIHVVSPQCYKNTICGKPIPESPSILSRKAIWESTCAKCKKILSPVK